MHEFLSYVIKSVAAKCVAACVWQTAKLLPKTPAFPIYSKLHYPLKRSNKWPNFPLCTTTRIGHGDSLLLSERYLYRDELLAVSNSSQCYCEIECRGGRPQDGVFPLLRAEQLGIATVELEPKRHGHVLDFVL